MYFSFGEQVDATTNAEGSSVVGSLLAACAANPAFEVIEQRRWASEDTGPCDVVVVDCINDQVPTRNSVGVRSRERLALVLPHDQAKAPQVRALRTTFPVVMHLNQVPDGEPACLCIYFEPWSHVRREWTPERFLQRVLFWLTGTATETLHREGQPLEAMYFESPVDLVLPPNWETSLDEDKGRVFVLAPIQRDAKRCTLRGLTVSPNEARKEHLRQTIGLRIRVSDVVHGGVERFPATLGDLAESLEQRGASLLQPLVAEIRRLAEGDGISPVPGQECLLLLSIPTKRTTTGPVEMIVRRGFKVGCELWQLGVQTGALSESAGKYYAVSLFGKEPEAGVKWRELPLLPVALKEGATRDSARRASDVPVEGADDARILAGVGALGSAMLDLWTRECWGVWTIADPDAVQPHNVVRHIARDFHVGHYKVDIVKDVVDSTYPFSSAKVTAFRGDVAATNEPRLLDHMKRASLLVDATTTLEVPRELSQRDDVPRCASAFLTPSGSSSVLLLESSTRDIRLDELEAQYYGAILENEWGEKHLAGHQGELWVGAGCRDISLILSDELVALHAAMLARQIRIRSSAAPAQLRTWLVDDETGGVRALAVPVRSPIHYDCGEWTVVSNEGVKDRLVRLRAGRLPVETGGVLIGYVDHPIRRVFIVDALPAPADSQESATGFVRGVDGLAETLNEVRRRTAGIVGYIGEWHSHPPFNSPRPSGDDVGLLTHLAKVLALDGVPAVMIIVGADGEISCSLGARGPAQPRS